MMMCYTLHQKRQRNFHHLPFLLRVNFFNVVKNHTPVHTKSSSHFFLVNLSYQFTVLTTKNTDTNISLLRNRLFLLIELENY